jgi:hypothetical protein
MVVRPRALGGVVARLSLARDDVASVEANLAMTQN